jgi:hypothetical protein
MVRLGMAVGGVVHRLFSLIFLEGGIACSVRKKAPWRLRPRERGAMANDRLRGIVRIFFINT